jgi:hypothetical protein
MKINLFHKDYSKIESLYSDFLSGSIMDNPIYSSFDEVEIDEIIPFEIYFGGSVENKRAGFLASLYVVKNYFEKVEKEYLYDQRFWNTIFLKYCTQYYLDKYPELKENKEMFYKRVFHKKFDWENYVYKLVIAVDFIENNVDFEHLKEKYYSMVYENLDVFNYIIKYSIFRSGDFLVKIFRIIENNDLSSELKGKLRHLSGDQRLGRMIIFELNKIYPVIMSPLMTNDELELAFMEIYTSYLHAEKDYLKSQ